MIIFSNQGAPQTADLKFEQAGYYVEKGLFGIVTATTIHHVDADVDKAASVYTLDGRLVRTNGSLDNLPKGVYIINGKKHVLK
jgi:hypothetical protein